MNTNSRLLQVPGCGAGGINADQPGQFRVRVEQTEPEIIRLEPVGQVNSDVTSPFRMPPKCIPATLLDLGPDGIGIRVSQHAASQLLAFVHCRCELKLPFSQQPQLVAVQVSHSRPLPEGSCYVGLVFEFAEERRRAVSRSWDRPQFEAGQEERQTQLTNRFLKSLTGRCRPAS
jgi:hypothetical protein